MKKKLHVFAVLAIFVTISLTQYSCGGFLGIEITDQSSIDDNLRPKITEIIGDDAQVHEISLIMGGGTTFSTTISMANVYYFDSQSDEIKCKTITLSGKLEGKDSKTISSSYKKIKPEKSQKLSEIDFSKIAANVNKAGEMVEAEEYEASGVRNYDIKLDSDPKKIKHRFSIDSRQGSETVTTNRGFATEISYLTFKFEADAEGNVTAKD